MLIPIISLTFLSLASSIEDTADIIGIHMGFDGGFSSFGVLHHFLMLRISELSVEETFGLSLNRIDSSLEGVNVSFGMRHFV
jgi:hypothetical protein